MTDTYAGARAVLDADSHIMESPDWLISYVAPLYRERFAALDLSSAGELGRRAEAMFAQITSEHDPLKLEEDVIGGPKGWAALGAWDPAERSRALDLLDAMRLGNTYVNVHTADYPAGAVRGQLRVATR